MVEYFTIHCWILSFGSRQSIAYHHSVVSLSETYCKYYEPYHIECTNSSLLEALISSGICINLENGPYVCISFGIQDLKLLIMY